MGIFEILSRSLSAADMELLRSAGGVEASETVAPPSESEEAPLPGDVVSSRLNLQVDTAGAFNRAALGFGRISPLSEKKLDPEVVSFLAEVRNTDCHAEDSGQIRGEHVLFFQDCMQA